MLLALQVAVFVHFLREGLASPRVCDYAQFHAAGRVLERGELATLYDFRVLAKVQDGFLPPRPERMDWNYPPSFALLCWPCSRLDYRYAWAVWCGLTWLVFLAGCLAMTRDPTLRVMALASPAVLLNLSYGQNGLLSAGLACLGTALVTSSPSGAGLAFAGLSTKPHLAVLVPVALGSIRAGRALAVFLAASAAWALLSWVVCDPGAWPAFLAKLPVIERQMETGPWHYAHTPTLYGTLRVLGFDHAGSKAAHLVSTLLGLLLVVRVWRNREEALPRAGALGLGAVLLTPYAFEYDLALLAPTVASLAAEGRERGLRPGELLVLVAGFGLPFAAPLVTRELGLPVSPLVLFALAAAAWRMGTPRAEGAS